MCKQHDASSPAEHRRILPAVLEGRCCHMQSSGFFSNFGFLGSVHAVSVTRTQLVIFVLPLCLRLLSLWASGQSYGGVTVGRGPLCSTGSSSGALCGPLYIEPL